MYHWLVDGTIVAASCGVAAISAYAWARVRGYWVVPTVEETDSDGFSLERYEPMKRLLSSDDLDFLKSRPGVPAKMVRQFKAQRRKVFRAYLQDLAADFRSLHRQLREQLANAPAEYEAELQHVLSQQGVFWMALLRIEVRLALSDFGIEQVDLSALFGSFGAVQQTLRRHSSGIETA